MRTSYCNLCGTVLRNKLRGRPKMFCPNCNCAIYHYWNEDYRAKNRKRINTISRKYHEAHREEIRAKGRELYQEQSKKRQQYNNKLIDDILNNPRKYLRRV